MDWFAAFKVLLIIVLAVVLVDFGTRVFFCKSDLKYQIWSVHNSRTLVVAAHGTGGSINSAKAIAAQLNANGVDLVAFDECGTRSSAADNAVAIVSFLNSYLASHPYDTVVLWGMSKAGKELAWAGSLLDPRGMGRKVLLLHETPVDAADIKLAPAWVLNLMTAVLKPGVLSNLAMTPVMRAMAGAAPDVSGLNPTQQSVALDAHERGSSVPFSTWLDQVTTASRPLVWADDLAGYARIGYIVDAHSTVVNGPQAMATFQRETALHIQQFAGPGQHVGVEYDPDGYAALFVQQIIPWATQ